jgi:basic membrane protein A
MNGCPFFSLILILLMVFTSSASAVDQAGMVIVYPGEKGDSSYIDSAAQGVELATETYSVLVEEFFRVDSSGEPILVNDGASERVPDLVLVLGYQLSPLAMTIAESYPSVPVIGIDTENLTGNNSRTIRFSPYGASYLAGVLAANQTKTNQIAVIAGKPDPNVDEFIAGFADGAKKENPAIVLQTVYIANDISGFNNPEKGAALASSLAANGTDILFPVAGGSGVGVIREAVNLSGVRVIGVDTDQSSLGPDVVIASVIKNIDQVVYREIKSTINGSFSPGFELAGLSNGGSELRFNPRFANLSSVITPRIDEASVAESQYQR